MFPFTLLEEQVRFTSSAYEFLMQRNSPTHVIYDQSHGWSDAIIRDLEWERQAIVIRQWRNLLLAKQAEWRRERKAQQ